MTFSNQVDSNASDFSRALAILNWLCSSEAEPCYRGLIVAAHPDDEIIGIGTRLSNLRASCFVHVTDGSPRNMHDAEAHGFTRREDYSSARRVEFFRALALAGLDHISYRCLDFPDQEATSNLCAITEALADLISREGPDFILTHPYEGGHPDHDATAFAAQQCRRLLLRRGQKCPPLLEFTSYHNGSNGIRVGEFLEEAPTAATVLLSESEFEMKRQMFQCFKTQQQVLRWFPIRIERLRVAPTSDFSLAPHPGLLFYELFPWGMDGERWRREAAQAIAALDLERQIN